MNVDEPPHEEPLDPRPLMSRCLTTMKELNQELVSKPFSVEWLVQMLHCLVQRSCRSASQLFCCPINALTRDKSVWRTAQSHQPTDDARQAAIRSPPSTILIVNISNSTLIDCVIGSDAYPSVMAERQPLLHKSSLHMHDDEACSCSCSQQGAAQSSPPPPPPPPPPRLAAESPSISIHGSSLNCVIIGDNNYMHAEQTTYSGDVEEAQV